MSHAKSKYAEYHSCPIKTVILCFLVLCFQDFIHNTLIKNLILKVLRNVIIVINTHGHTQPIWAILMHPNMHYFLAMISYVIIICNI